jgi:hypothetical protein
MSVSRLTGLDLRQGCRKSPATHHRPSPPNPYKRSFGSSNAPTATLIALSRKPQINNTDLRTITQSLKLYDFNQLSEVAPALQANPITRPLFIRHIQSVVHSLVQQNIVTLQSGTEADQKMVLDTIRDQLMLISPEALQSHTGLTVNPGKIDRKILACNTQYDYAIIAFLVDGPGTVHNHKEGVVGVGVSLDSNAGVELRFSQVFPDSDPNTLPYNLVAHHATIPQQKGTTLYELGADALVHQITITREGQPNIRVHFYFGGDVSKDGNPNDYTQFVRPVFAGSHAIV